MDGRGSSSKAGYLSPYLILRGLSPIRDWFTRSTRRPRLIDFWEFVDSFEQHRCQSYSPDPDITIEYVEALLHRILSRSISHEGGGNVG